MTSEELIAELAAIMSSDGPDDAFTTRELSNMLGIGEKATRRRLHVLDKAGRLDVVTVQRRNLAGVSSPTTAYRVAVSGIVIRTNAT